MNRKRTWLFVLAALFMLIGAALLVAACGPELATPTPKGETSPTAAAVNAQETGAVTPTEQAAVTAEPTAVPVDVSKLPVDPSDYHALGPANAAVTIVEYSDFQ